MSAVLLLETDWPASDDPQAIHDAVHAFGLRMLERAALVLPDPADPASDRLTRATLSAEDLQSAEAMSSAYQAWLETYIAHHGDRLSKSGINLLRANASEIDRHLRVSWCGHDLPPELYRQLHVAGLTKWIESQRAICAGAADAVAPTPRTRRRRAWRPTPLTVGVEEEYQIVSTDTWDLQPDADLLLGAAARPGGGALGREAYKCQIEMTTPVCKDIHEVAAAIARGRDAVQDALPPRLAVVSAGSHPFAQWSAQPPTDSARTQLFIHDLQDVMRRVVTFGLHVHVGIDDPTLALDALNGVRGYLPLMLALTASSPFWQGRFTGVASYRSTVVGATPRTGIPPFFASRDDFDAYCALLGKTRAFDSLGTFDTTKIWWDARLHPKYPTLEIRICDACPRQADAVSIAALCQALVAKLTRLRRQGLRVPRQRRHVTEENKWRAARHGCRATFIDDTRGEEVPALYQALETLDFVDDVLDECGSRAYVERIVTVLRDGTGADRQLDEYRQTKDLRAVVKRLASQFVGTGPDASVAQEVLC